MKIDSYDLEECKLLIKEGSHSFYAASKLLPKYVRDPAIVLYAFCRIADDVVDVARCVDRTAENDIVLSRTSVCVANDATTVHPRPSEA